MANENKAGEIKIENLQREEKELTPEEAREVKGGLKAAPTFTDANKETTPQV
jgi:hypothetical protein